MSSSESSPPLPPPATLYGRVIRERGTVRILVGAAIMGLLYWAYSAVMEARLNETQWPALSPSKEGLVVLGLRDVNRPGWRRKYVAVESNKSWQIRRPDDAEAAEEEGAPEEFDDTPEARDRGGSNPGATHRVARGPAVTIEEVMASCPVVLNGSHFTGASVEERRENLPPPFDRTYWVVHISLTEEGRSRFWQFRRKHVGERLVWVLNGEIVTCTQMNDAPPPYLSVFERSLSIQPIWVKADAQRLADSLNSYRRQASAR